MQVHKAQNSTGTTRAPKRVAAMGDDRSMLVLVGSLSFVYCCLFVVLR